ncbi:SusC/RagA family TonB-linked outer membrane protein [Sphingobacterium phlebotomi]|uniref:SusC/RagA family TonB-linked outer membrane protein n=1 Tax=Sphingobacterium phlebotomi TaxID=2605433 RepID=A0A5D4HAH3_9SPHI|nr:SusC/RagA family TonB-linked outer membrane protein [Sphingobacterium phlebotomi]TYR37322.1 SusC/RagA family TonB-linked outer membrane protein [Sphingobacterium phlebotomi]
MKKRFKTKGLFLALNIIGMSAFAQETSDAAVDSVITVNVKTAAPTFSELLVKEPAVQVIQSGTVGNASQLMIRGLSSINMNASPFVYVDGIPVRYTRSLPSFLSVFQPSRFNFINPYDIRDIKVVKEGKELSEIGGRGANGAIYIETDRGELGGTKIDFSAKFGVASADYNIDRMDASQFKNYLGNYLLENGSTQEELDQNPIFDTSSPLYNHNTDWLGMITRNARISDYHIKLKGGDGDTRYMFSVGYADREGTIKGSDMNQANLRFNIDYKLSPKIEIANHLAYTYAKVHYAEQGFNYSIRPLFNAVTKAPFMSPYLFSESGEISNRLADVDVLGKSNPISLVENMYNNNEDNRVDGNIVASWLMQPGTYLRSSFVFNYMNLTEKQYRPAYGIVPDLNRTRQNLKRNSSEATILWNTWFEKNGSFGKVNKYFGKAGLSVESYEEKAVFARKINAGTDDYETLDQGILDSASNSKYNSRLAILYLRGNVDLLNKINIGANLNIEGSSNFGREGRWGIYPGVDTEIDLLDRSKHNQLAFRAGWGRTGNNDLRGYYHYNLYSAANYYGYGGAYLGNIANESIKPEVTDMYDAGITLGLFDRKLVLNGGYYYKSTSDLITQRTLPIELGLDPQFENNGKMASQGIEINLNATLINQTALSWSVFGSFSTLKNKVKELRNEDIVKSIGGVSTIASVNESIGAFYGYKVLGVFASDEAVNLQKSDGTNFKAGDYIIQDINNDSKINDLDRQVIGSALPEVFGNFGTFLNYKQVSLNALFTYAVGNDIYNSFNQQMHLMADYSNQSPDVAGRYISPSSPGTGLSRAALDDPSSNGVTSDLWVEDGSYLRLKNITVSYEVPIATRMAFFRALNVYVTAENLMTFTKYSGLDPEVVTTPDPMLRGIDFGASPLSRSYIVGLKMSF